MRTREKPAALGSPNVEPPLQQGVQRSTGGRCRRQLGNRHARAMTDLFAQVDGAQVASPRASSTTGLAYQSVTTSPERVTAGGAASSKGLVKVPRR